ncbi:MAG: serine/threonine-protein kinase [Gemmatimonadales bacterium]
MSQKKCPKCGTLYGTDAKFCPKDGAPLVAVLGDSGSTQIRQAVKPPPATVDPAKTLRNQVLDQRYEVGRKLGEGGMSFVYEAKDISTGVSVAVKIMTPKLAQDKVAAERLRREAGLAMRLDHPNICRILRLGETPEGLIYLVMPLLKGELLSDKEVRDGPMPLEMGIPLMRQVCDALAFAHEQQIVHRDLKPENIFLVPDKDGKIIAMVTDFGLAKERRAEPGMAKLTATGIILGTPEFMSPEQIRGKPLDGRSDIYALGLVAYEMFTGRLPFEGKSAQDMMIARLRGQPLPLRKARADLTFSPDFEKALMKAIEAEPNDRYQNARELGDALAQATGRSSLMDKIKGKLF